MSLLLVRPHKPVLNYQASILNDLRFHDPASLLTDYEHGGLWTKSTNLVFPTSGGRSNSTYCVFPGDPQGTTGKRSSGRGYLRPPASHRWTTLQATDFTVHLWVRPWKTSSWFNHNSTITWVNYDDKIFGDSTSQTVGWGLYSSPGAALRLRVGSLVICQTADGVYGVGSWQHVALTRIGTQFYIHINGQLRAQGTYALNLPAAESNGGGIGWYGTADSNWYVHLDVDNIQVIAGMGIYDAQNFTPPTYS